MDTRKTAPSPSTRARSIRSGVSSFIDFLPGRTCCELDRSAHRELSTGDTKCLINVAFLQVCRPSDASSQAEDLSPPGLLSGRFDYDRYGCRTEPFYIILRDVMFRFFELTSFPENFYPENILKHNRCYRIAIRSYIELISRVFNANDRPKVR